MLTLMFLRLDLRSSFIIEKKKEFTITNKESKLFLSKKNIDFILFFNKVLSQTESRYWFTKLEMIDLIWTVKRIAHLIKFFKHFIIIYIDHEANSTIVSQIKFSITNINKLNMKLIKASRLSAGTGLFILVPSRPSDQPKSINILFSISIWNET